MKKNIYIEIILVLLIAIFLFSGISKIIHIKDLSIVLDKFPVLGNRPDASAWLLLIIELSIALMLMFPASALMGIRLAIVYLIIASSYIGSVLLFADRSMCTCAAFFKMLSWPQHIMINLVLIVIGAGVLIARDREKRIERNQQRKQFSA